MKTKKEKQEEKKEFETFDLGSAIASINERVSQKRFGRWEIKSNGDLVFNHPENNSEYVIEKTRLQEKDWISHINMKYWGRESMSDFITAYFRALNNIGFNEITIKIL